MSNLPPNELELRGRPRPIRRLNKRALMMGAATVALLLTGAMVLALDPPTLLVPPARSELYNTDHKQTADGLAKLPTSYAEVPVLGPPVPGDIGRAFVEGEKRLGLQPPALEASIKPDPEDEAQRAERIRQARIAQQAKESGLFFPFIRETEAAAAGRFGSKQFCGAARAH
jgi:type IV secretion system protein TrbI